MLVQLVTRTCNLMHPSNLIKIELRSPNMLDQLDTRGPNDIFQKLIIYSPHYTNVLPNMNHTLPTK